MLTSREWFLRFDWQISETNRIEAAYLDLSSISDFDRRTTTFEETRELRVTPIELPFPITGGDLGPSELRELSVLRDQWLRGIGGLDFPTRADRPGDLASIELTTALRAVHREGGSFVTVHLAFECTEESQVGPRFYVENPELTIVYSAVP